MSDLHGIESSAYERAIRYVAKVPCAVQGKSGDKKTFALTCALANGLLLDDEATLSVLEDWNQSCQPPWDTKDLVHKIREARKSPPPKGKQYGWLLDNSKTSASVVLSNEQSDKATSTSPKSIKAEESSVVINESASLIFDAEPNESLIAAWAGTKPPIESFSVQEFGGVTANYFPKPVTYPKWYQHVIAIPMFDMNCGITGYIMHKADGGTFDKAGKQRFMITPGSKAGLICNPEQLALLHNDDCPIEYLVRPEGVSDTLALYSSMPEEVWRKYLIVSPGCGAGQGVDSPPYSELLELAAAKNLKVVVVGDNDMTGSSGADKWCCGAFSQGCDTQRSRLPNEHNGCEIKDVRDYLQAGGSWEEIVHELTSPWTRSDLRSRCPNLINLADVEKKEVTWLWPNKIPAGAISMLVGPQGLGKTFLSVYMASVITNGRNWADGTPCEQGSVLFFYGEDEIATVYKPRCEANGADQSKICFLEGVKVFKGDTEVDEVMSIKSVDVIKAAIHMTEEDTGLPVRLVVIDPISNYWNGVKENDNAEVRAALTPIQRLAEETGVAFLLTSHVGKTDRDTATQRVLGSTALTAVARAVWMVYPHEDKKGHLYFAPSKSNLSVNPTSVEFYINPKADGRVDVIDAMIEKDADDFEVERRAKKRGRKPTASNAAKDWLMQFLSIGPKSVGTRDASEPCTVYYEGLAAGHSSRTIDRVKKDAKVQSRKRQDGSYEWYLPVTCEVKSPATPEVVTPTRKTSGMNQQRKVTSQSPIPRSGTISTGASDCSGTPRPMCAR